MQFHLGDIFTAGNLVILLAIWRKLSIRDYQHMLMWVDFAAKKGISANGAAKARGAGSE